MAAIAGRRALLGITAALALAGLGGTAAADGTAGAPSAPARGAEPIDDGGAPPNRLDPSLIPGALLDEAASPAKSVEQLDPGGASGFLPLFGGVRSRSYGAYRLQLVTSGSDGDVERTRAAVVEAAAQLTLLTNLTFTVDPGQVPRPTTVGRYAPRECPGGGGHRCSFFSDNELVGGVIRVGLSSGSPCGPLAPSGVEHGAVGCGGPESAFAAGTLFHLRGNVWLSPSLGDVNAALAGEVVAHEIGHAIGLGHFTPTFSAIPGAQPVRQLMFPSVHTDPSDTGLHYRSGDAQGVWWLHPDEAWFITATYRDFLGRVPDTAGYHHWLTAEVTRDGYVDALTTSDEWVGRIVSDFYADVFGRPADPAGFAYWAGAVRLFGVPAVAGQLYGSVEYVQAQGGTTTGFVQAMYRQVLDRDPAADPQGVAYWVAQADLRGRVAVASELFQSNEKRRNRVSALYCTLLDRPPDAGGQAYWADVILLRGDLALAKDLATSQEYTANADEFSLLPLQPGPAPPGC